MTWPRPVGSIPVHTGKPSSEIVASSPNKVYPRTHGETYRKYIGAIDEKGLSPYTRGNLPLDRLSDDLTGSIPVHTGKPYHSPHWWNDSWVYPRTHGETAAVNAFLYHYGGLSPYTRGNPVTMEFSGECAGSIPVHTGKPISFSHFREVVMVYPRTHGETRSRQKLAHTAMGLSPYTRGNLRR